MTVTTLLLLKDLTPTQKSYVTSKLNTKEKRRLWRTSAGFCVVSTISILGSLSRTSYTGSLAPVLGSGELLICSG